MRLTVLGIGNVRCAPAIVGSLSNYFGERPLEIRFWDADWERLDLFDRFARLCFHVSKCPHQLISTDESDEALDESSGVILAIGRNCAHKFLRSRGSLLGHGETGSVLVQRCASELLNASPLDASVISLISVEPDGRPWQALDWPPEPTEGERRGVPHQILRFLNGDEYPHQFLKEYASSPITVWLNELMLRSS